MKLFIIGKIEGTVTMKEKFLHQSDVFFVYFVIIYYKIMVSFLWFFLF